MKALIRYLFHRHVSHVGAHPYPCSRKCDMHAYSFYSLWLRRYRCANTAGQQGLSSAVIEGQPVSRRGSV